MHAYKSPCVAVVICAMLVNTQTVGLVIIGHIGDGFYGSKDPTNSVKALKEDRFLKIRLQSRQVYPTVLQ